MYFIWGAVQAVVGLIRRAKTVTLAYTFLSRWLRVAPVLKPPAAVLSRAASKPPSNSHGDRALGT